MTVKIGSHMERHNLSITPVKRVAYHRTTIEYYASCDKGDLHQSCATEEAARQAVFNHAVEDARLPKTQPLADIKAYRLHPSER